MITSMISLFLLIHLSLGDQVLFVDPSGRHIKAGHESAIRGTGAVNDAVGRLFYLGYIDEQADTSYLALPRESPRLTRNLMITVTGLEDVKLTKLEGAFTMEDKTIEGFRRLVGMIHKAYNTEATIISLSGEQLIAEGLVGDFGTAKFASQLTPKDSELLLKKFGLDGNNEQVQELLQELALLHDEALFPTEGPGFNFVTLVKLSQIPAGPQKEKAAKLVEHCLAELLKKFKNEYPRTGLAEVMLLQNPDATQQLRGYANTEKELSSIRRRLQTGNNSDPGYANFTYGEMYTTQIRYWISIVLGITTYTFCYYMAFYGNYSADQMLYTSFNAKWDERKMK